jgi:hypothetical protein
LLPAPDLPFKPVRAIPLPSRSPNRQCDYMAACGASLRIRLKRSHREDGLRFHKAARSAAQCPRAVIVDIKLLSCGVTESGETCRDAARAAASRLNGQIRRRSVGRPLPRSNNRGGTKASVTRVATEARWQTPDRSRSKRVRSSPRSLLLVRAFAALAVRRDSRADPIRCTAFTRVECRKCRIGE